MSLRRLRGRRDERPEDVLDLDERGRLSGGGMPRPRRASTPSDAAVPALARALLEALRLLVRAVDPADPERGRLAQLEEAAARARLPDDYRAVAEALAAVQLDPLRSGDGAALDGTRLFHHVVQGARGVAEALANTGAVLDLEELARVPAITADDERPLIRLLRTFETFAREARTLREGNGLMKETVTELVDTLSRLSGGEERTVSELTGLLGRLRAAEAIEDLETLRAELIAQASSLVDAAAGRAAAVEQALAQADTSRARAEELEAKLTRVEARARTDALTGLENRHALIESVRARQGAAEPVGVLLIDLDHFKAINDSYGHAAGDAVLRGLGALVRRELRGADEAYRVGGEELLVLLPGSSWQGARSTAERLRRRIGEAPLATLGGDALGATASIGIALWSGDEPFEDAANRADEALYRAKAAGRDRVVG